MSTYGDNKDLADVTAHLSDVKVGDNAESAKRAREVGWVEPTEFDYEAYNATPKDEEGTAGVSTWAANATKYEWNEEYGDVGPAHPLLEKILFGDENQVKKGKEFDT